MRALIAVCFQRPVAVTAFYVLALALAAVAYVRLPVALLPDLRFPTLVVWTAYPSVAPGRVERAVTERIEEAVAGTEGLQRMTSRTILGGALVRLDFGWNADLDLAMLSVREQLDRLGNALPEAAERPIVLRIDPTDEPMMWVALRSAGQGGAQDLVGLKLVGREVVARRVEQLDGVARAIVTGGYERQIDIDLDMARLAAYDLGIDDIASRLRLANVALPGGMIRRGPFRFAIEVSGEFASLVDIEQTVISRPEAPIIRLADVARVREGVAERQGLVRLDGEETLLLLIERKPDANTVDTAAEVREVLDELRQALPGIALDVVVDESVFIEEAIDGVVQALWLGGVLAILILYAFLRRVRMLLTMAIAVPLSLAITLVLFEVLDVSFNLISLSGLALGVGMLVDNAIIVVENIARLRETGLKPREAARRGVTEVAGAITASTLTTIAVFLPLTFVDGLAGQLFRDQSLAVVGSLVASLIVALTAVPLMALWAERASAKKMLGKAAPAAKKAEWRLYERILTWCLAHRVSVVACVLLLMVAGLGVGWSLPRAVVPTTNQGRAEVHLSLPPESDLSLVDAEAQSVGDGLLLLPSVEQVLADIGERDEARLDLDPRPRYESVLTVLLAEGKNEQALRDVIASEASPWAGSSVQLEVKPIRTQLERLLTSEDADLFIDLIAEERAVLAEGTPALLDALQEVPALANVREADALNVPAYRILLDRDAMQRFGVASNVLTTYIEAAARGRRATELRTVNEEVPLVLRSRREQSIDELLAQRIPTPSGLLPLGAFVRAEAVSLPASLIRSRQTSVVRLLADVAPGAGLQDAVQEAETVLRAAMPAGTRFQVGGSNEAFLSSLRAVGLTMLMSVVLVYLILTAQFESLVQPLIVLAIVPIALACVGFVLWATGTSLNLMSLTGCAVLIGIVVNDAIVKVEVINQRRAEGFSIDEAIHEAGRDRIRPIIMTTLTTVLGLAPLALGIGEGAELRQPLAIAIAGGLLLATGLTLFVTGTLYKIGVRAEPVAAS
ncbi:MAG: efflux RND transporter permease subunit [Bacteroidota bacterium]